MEFLAVAKWFLALLQSDATLWGLLDGRAFDTVAPDVTPDDPESAPLVYPLLTFQVLKGTEAHAAGGETTVVFPNLLVKLYGEQGYGGLEPLYSRLCDLLKAPEPQHVDVGGSTFVILGATRNFPLMYPEIENGVRFDILGGSYKVPVQKLS